MAKIFKNMLNYISNSLKTSVCHHIKNGVLIYLFKDLIQAGFASGFGVLMFFGMLVATAENNPKGFKMRVVYLLGFTTLTMTGAGMGPLLKYVIAADPNIMVTALIGTAVIFVSCLICSLWAEKSKWLLLGGILVSLLATILISAMAYFFYDLSMPFQVHVYKGLTAMCVFLYYDIQFVIGKRRVERSKDCVAHFMDLFIDLIGLFWRVLLIFTQRKQMS